MRMAIESGSTIAETAAGDIEYAESGEGEPMLVIHGDKDYRVPIGEGLRLWAELAERGAPFAFEIQRGGAVHVQSHIPQRLCIAFKVQ